MQAVQIRKVFLLVVFKDSDQTWGKQAGIGLPLPPPPIIPSHTPHITQGRALGVQEKGGRQNLGSDLLDVLMWLEPDHLLPSRGEQQASARQGLLPQGGGAVVWQGRNIQ